jgi:hypothetical protein
LRSGWPPNFSGKVVIAGHTRQKGGEVLDLGFLKLIDTEAFGNGWLTALEAHTGEVIHANQQGQLKRSGTTPSLYKAAQGEGTEESQVEFGLSRIPGGPSTPARRDGPSFFAWQPGR